MKKIVTIILSTILSMSALINPVSAELSTTIEEKGDFLYTYDGISVEAKYKKRNSKQEILRIEFPEKNNGKEISKIGFTNFDDDIKAQNLNVNTLFVPKTVKEVYFECVYYYNLCESSERYISLKNIEVDKDNPYLCSKDGVLYSKDMKTIHLYPNRNSMTVYKMPNSIEEYTGSPLFIERNNIQRLYLSDNLKYIGESFASKCKNLKFVYVGTNTKEIEQLAFNGDKKLKTVKINSKKLKSIEDLTFSGCSNLKKINIPSTVKIIGEGAFWKCKSLKKITLPKNLKSIGFSAFADCKKLSKVIINNKKKAPKISKDVVNSETGVYKDAFKNTKKGIKFYVKNKKVAKSLKKQLKGSGVRNAKILIGKKVVYKNVK